MCNKAEAKYVINLMEIGKRSLLSAVFALLCCSMVFSQERKVMNRPYLDMRKFHYGFLFGFHIQDLELANNGYTDPETGEQWYADINNYNPGFTVGVLGEMRLSTYFSLRVCPTIHFGQKHVVFHEQATARDTTQNIKSTYISLPVDIKFAAPRYNNFRPYLIAGAAPTIDLTTRKHGMLMLKPMDVYLEVGMGCDIYLPFFKLNPELKFCFGLADILKKDRKDLIDERLRKFTKTLDGGSSKMIVLTFYFE